MLLPQSGKDIEAWLVKRGLDGKDIDCGMSRHFGEDWVNIRTSELIGRLRAKGFAIDTEMPLFIDEIEIIVRGVLLHRHSDE